MREGGCGRQVAAGGRVGWAGEQFQLGRRRRAGGQATGGLQADGLPVEGR
jgi:hypothetical protein